MRQTGPILLKGDAEMFIAAKILIGVNEPRIKCVSK